MFGVGMEVGSDLELLLGLERDLAVLRVRRARLLAQLDLDAVTTADCGLRTASWVARYAKRPSRVTRGELSVARTATVWFPDLLDAVEDPAGGVGPCWDHVELLVKVSNARNRGRLASVQPELVAAARELSFRDWERLVRTVAVEADEDGSHDPNTDLAANRLALGVNPDGTRELNARLVGDSAVVVDATLEAIADELFTQWSQDQKQDPDVVIPPRRTLLALALTEACRRAHAIDLGSSRPARSEAVIVVDTDHTGTPVVTDQRGNPVPKTALDVLLNDADLRAVLVNTDRVPLAMGRKVRLATAEQRKALLVRDGGCVFPGCDTPAPWCDAHHIEAWDKHGNTDLDNLALICRHHHRLTHQNHWTMTAAATHTQPTRFTWTTPNGRTLHSQHQPPGRPTREHPRD